MSKREAIIQLHCAGRTNSEIIKLLKVAKPIVYHVMNRSLVVSLQDENETVPHTNPKAQETCKSKASSWN